jgi:hypothetical protein
MSKNLRERIMTAAVISIGVSLGLGLSLAPSALAQNDPGVQNDFGQAAESSPPGFLGEHSRAGSDATGDPPYTENPVTGDPDKAGRLGIGNVGDTVCGEKITPGELARFLQTGQCP